MGNLYLLIIAPRFVCFLPVLFLWMGFGLARFMQGANNMPSGKTEKARHPSRVTGSISVFVAERLPKGNDREQYARAKNANYVPHCTYGS
jgi:hypothetical protein